MTILLIMAGYNQMFHKELLATVIKCSILSGFTYYAVRWLLSRIEPGNSDQRRNARERGVHKLEKLGKNKIKLTEYELLIASNLVVPSDITVNWNNIAGLESIIDELNETVIFPVSKCKSLTNSKLISPPKGVLLYGPPGCGKTLIAKATAKEAVCAFINLDISMLTDKWYGESQKLVSAVFSLASKLQPAIIFIDEIDSLLRSRSSHDHEATAMMKAQFMLLWDGLCTDNDNIVIVMGATNRPDDIDCAILRRMPATFKIPLPNAEQREEILKLILSEESTEEIDFNFLSENTNLFSGADLKELCRVASLCRVKEYAKRMRSEKNSSDLEFEQIRPITMEDMKQALKSVGRK